MPRVYTVYVSARPRQVINLVNSIPRIVGQRTGAGGFVQINLIRIGMALLGRIKKAFVVRSHGGTDETGLRWRPLSPKTIAYSRRHTYFTMNKAGNWKQKWVPKGSVRAKSAPSWMLTDAQRTRWWHLYYLFGGRKPQGAAYHKNNYNDIAAAKAWIVLKSEGAQTLLMVFGNEQVDILRDTGALLNSLSPKVQPASATTPDRMPNQVFRLIRGGVEVGTNRRWALAHHEGLGGNVQRRLWPEPSRWTSAWRTDMLEQCQAGVLDILLYLLGKQP